MFILANENFHIAKTFFFLALFQRKFFNLVSAMSLFKENGEYLSENAALSLFSLPIFNSYKNPLTTDLSYQFQMLKQLFR